MSILKLEMLGEKTETPLLSILLFAVIVESMIQLQYNQQPLQLYFVPEYINVRNPCNKCSLQLSTLEFLIS